MNILQTILFPHLSISGRKLSDCLSEKTVVITGASYGIGEQTALLFSQYKVHLILIARTQEKLVDLARKTAENGSQATIIAADLYQESETDRVISELQKLPKIDIFISNAGKSINRPLSASLDRYHDFTRTNSLNYLAPVKLLLAATPLLSRSKGQAVNVSALNVLLLPPPGWAGYQASKNSFDQWFRCNLAEWNAMGVTGKTIYLPLVKTRMIAPNENYKNYPAMQPQQAAIRIAKLICSDRRFYKPWWSIFSETSSFLGRYLWEPITFYRMRKRKWD